MTEKISHVRRRKSFPRLRALAENRHGGVLIIVAGSIIVMMLLLGAAVDIGRAYLVRAKLSAALDAGALAAGARAFSGEKDEEKLRQEALSFFYANLPANFLDSRVDIPVVTFIPDGNGQRIHLTGQAHVDTLFLRFVPSGVFETLDVGGLAEVSLGSSVLELSMVLDLSASMHWSGRIEGLRTAATKLLDILFAGEDTVDGLYVGMAPYAAGINIGTERVGWVEPSLYHPSMYGTMTEWRGCVQARDGNDFADEPPSPGRLFPPHWADPTLSKNKWAESAMPNGDGTWTVVGPEATDEVWDHQWTAPVTEPDPDKRGINPLPSPNARCLISSAGKIVPLVTKRSILQAQIDNFETAVWWGGTIHDQGLAWGWRVLSPRWRGMWGAPSENFLPLDYPASGAKAHKVLVMMTDGKAEIGGYTVWGDLSKSFMGPGINTSEAGVQKIQENFSSLCTTIKNQGITIFTIILGLNGNADTEKLFSDCSSGSGYYYNSPTPEEMIQAFTDIGKKIKVLRLSQ